MSNKEKMFEERKAAEFVQLELHAWSRDDVQASECCVVFAGSLSMSFWGEGEDPSSKAQGGSSHQPVTVHRTPPLTSTAEGAAGQSGAQVDCFPSQCTQDHRSASNRTNPQEHPAPT